MLPYLKALYPYIILNHTSVEGVRFLEANLFLDGIRALGASGAAVEEDAGCSTSVLELVVEDLLPPKRPRDCYNK